MQEKKEEAVRAERDALTIVDHPFIVHLYYTFQVVFLYEFDTQDSQNLYFVLTLCRGGSMWDVLKYGWFLSSILELSGYLAEVATQL